MVKASAQYAVRRVIDGEDSYIMTLDNDAHVIPTDSFGLNGNYDGASTTLYIFKGIIDDTANWTITPNPSTGVEGSLDGNVYTISKVTNDNSKIEFVAKKGNLQLKKTMSVTLSKSGYDSTIVSVMSDVTSIKNDTLNKVMIPSVVNFTAQLHDKNGLYPSQKGYFVIYEQARSSLTIDEYTGLLKTTTTVTDMEYVISDGQYPFVERYASVEPESSLSYPIMADDSLGVKVEFYKDLDRTIIWDRQTLPIVSDGVTTYTWRMYADDKFGNGMNAKPDGKRFMGISVNQTEKNPSNKINDYEWSPLYDNVKIGARNLIVTKTLTKGQYINDTTGSPASASTHSITDFISASPNEDYTLSSIKKILNQVRVGYYSATKALISVVLYSGAQGYEKNLKTPTGTAFVRLSGDESTGAPLADWKFEKGNVSTDWSPAPEDFSSDISELSTAITALGETAIPALKDSVLNQTEKDAVKREMEKVSAEKTDVDSQYSTIYVNANLIGTPKTNLSSAKGAYDTAHTNLSSAIGNVLAIANDKPISRTLIDAVTTNLKNYSSAVATFRARVELANASIRDYQINQAKSAVSSEVAGVNTALGKVKDFTDTAFADGVIQRAEAKAIQNQLNTLKVENGDLANQYNIVHANPNLTGTAKSELNSAYTTATTGYNARYNSLVLAINTAIGDGKITTAEKTSVDTAFNNYNTALKTLTEKLNNALVNIGEKISQDKVDGLEIGGRNLILDSAKEVTGSGYSITSYQWANVKDIIPKAEYTVTVIGDLKPQHTGWYLNIFDKNTSTYPAMITLNNSHKISEDTWVGTFKMPSSLVEPTGGTILYTQPFSNGIEGTVRKIQIEKGNKATDWTPAPEDIDADILNVSNATNSLKNFTNTAFVDGIISRAESQAIAEHLNTLNKEKSDLDNHYEVTYKNTNLAGVPKTNLLNAKSSYDTAHNNLISSINSAVSGNNTTPAQKKDVDDKFTAYTNAIKLLTQRFNEATLEISRKVSTDVSTGIADDKTGRNKWIVSRYQKSPAVIPVMADIRGLTPFETFVIDDFTDSLANTNTDNSTYHLSTYLYSNTAKNIVASIANDDTINVFLNGVSVYTKSVISGATNVTLPLVKGWNNIEVLLRTGTGNDYVRFATKLSSLVDDMSCYLGGGLSASQIRQISDEIDIRVQKGDVIASINASIEKDGSSALRLKGDKIQLNGNTEVDGNFKVSGDVLIGGTIKFDALNSGAQATINAKSTKAEAQGYAGTAETNAKKHAENALLADKTILDTRSTNQLPSWYYANYPKQEVREFKTASAIGVSGSNFGILTTDVPWVSSSGGSVKQTFRINNEVFKREGSTTWNAWVNHDTMAVNAKNKTDIWSYSGTTEINGASIRTGTLTANKITAGILKAQNGVSEFDLNSGEIRSTGTTTSTNPIGLGSNKKVEVRIDSGAVSLTNDTSNETGTYLDYNSTVRADGIKIGHVAVGDAVTSGAETRIASGLIDIKNYRPAYVGNITLDAYNGVDINPYLGGTTISGGTTINTFLSVNGKIQSTGSSLEIAPASGAAGIELGSIASLSPAHIDFHSSQFNTDYDTRIISYKGESGNGKGQLGLEANQITFNHASIYGDKIPLPKGDNSKSYWDSVKEGTYWADPVNNVTNALSLYAIVEVKKSAIGGDFFILWHVQPSGEVYKASGNSGTFSGWRGIGTAVQYGNNVNGHYVKYDDGTQICWGRDVRNNENINIVNGSIFRGNQIVYHYPVEFVGAMPVVSITAYDAWAVNMIFESRQSFATMLYKGTSVVGLRTAIGWKAIGRWK